MSRLDGLFQGGSPLALAPPGWPVHAPGLFMAFVDRVLLVRIDAQLTQASFDRYREEWLRAVDARSPQTRVAAYYEIPAWAGLTAKQRRDWATMLKSREEILRATTMAMALVTPSSLARGALRAIFWLAPPPYPYDVVDARVDGFAALGRNVPSLDAGDCMTQYERMLKRHLDGGSVAPPPASSAARR